MVSLLNTWLLPRFNVFYVDMRFPVRYTFLYAMQLADVCCSQSAVNNYKNLGVEELRPWQVQLFSTKTNILASGKNFVYTAPTSSGKTLVAEILCINRLVTGKKKALMVLPYVSLVAEKVEWMQKVLAHTNIRCEAFYGNDMDGRLGRKTSIYQYQNYEMAICTIEKANTLFQYLSQCRTLEDVFGIVVLDEIHLMDDDSRGYLLEGILTKLMYFQTKVQIIAMTATLPNLNVLSNWLKADLFVSHQRASRLVEYVLETDTQSLFPPQEPSQALQLTLPDLWPGLLTRFADQSVLIFCTSKAKCEILASKIWEHLPNLPDTQFVQEMVSLSIREDLCSLATRGLAFHHAGLSQEERKLVETNFRKKRTRILTCTSTLAAGVNLPCHVVIVSSPFTYTSNGMQLISPSAYKQMCGRAGRDGGPGLTILMTTQKDRQRALDGVCLAKLPPLSSALVSSRKGLHRVILEIVTVEDQTMERLNELAQNTLSRDPECVLASLEYLETNKLISLTSQQTYRATNHGHAIVSGNFAPDEGLLVLEEMQTFIGNPIYLSNEVQMCYCCTPISLATMSSIQLDYSSFRRELRSLVKDNRAMTFLGIHPSVIDCCITYGCFICPPKYPVTELRFRRFFFGVILFAFVRGMSMTEVSKRFSLEKGIVQHVSQSAASFAFNLAKLCGTKGWTLMEACILEFQPRLRFGSSRELIGILQINEELARRNQNVLTIPQARALYMKGFQKAHQLIHPHVLKHILDADKTFVMQVCSAATAFKRTRKPKLKNINFETPAVSPVMSV